MGEVAPGLVPAGSLWAWLGEHRGSLFPEESFADMFPSGLGRRSYPGPVMAMVLLLQAMEGLSDRDAVERLAYDLRWKTACGLGVDVPAPDHSLLVVWRSRIAASSDPDRIWHAVDRVVASCGVLRGKKRRVVDSTVVDDAVARQDTVRLLVWQVHRVRDLLPDLAPWIDCLPGRAWYADRLKPDIDWSSAEAKQDLVTVLVNDALAVVQRATAWLDAHGCDQVEAVRDQVGLLALLAGQDVEMVEGSTEQHPRWRVARKVAEDRVISVVDTQARHVRKSRASKRDGYKAHLMAEPDNGVIVAAGASTGTGPQSSDATVAVTMLTGRPPDLEPDSQTDTAAQDEHTTTSGTAAASRLVAGVEQVGGDSAYCSAAMLATCDALGIVPLVKPRPLHLAVAGGISIDDFDVDTDASTARCPGGFTVTRSPAGTADFTDHCHRCVLRPECTTARDGRKVRLGPEQLRAARHRADAEDPTFQAEYKQHRPKVERSLAWLLRPGRRTPYRGLTKTDAWIKRRAAAVNLKLLHTMGLTRQDGQWTLAAA